MKLRQNPCSMHTRELMPYLTLLFLITSCGDGDGGFAPTPGVSIAASPLKVHLTPSTAAQVQLTTKPAGRLTFKIADKPAWVHVTPESGRIDLKAVTITISAIDSLLPKLGVNRGTLEVVSEGGIVRIGIEAQAGPRPVASVKFPEIDFSQDVDTASTWLYNSGRGVLTWSASSSASWLEMEPTPGDLAAGDSVLLSFSIDRNQLPAGATNAIVTITSNSAKGDLTLTATAHVAAIAGIRLNQNYLSFPVVVHDRTLYVVNTGNVPLTWSAIPGQGWLSVNPAEASTEPGDSTRLVVTINRSAAASTGSLTIRSNAPTGDLLVPVAVGFEEVVTGRPIVLDHRVVDAELSPPAWIVTVSDWPPMLNIIDPETGVVQSIGLSATPTSLSVSPSGRFAAVGHDRAISYVDLVTRRVLRVYAVTIDVLDVIVGDHGWVYALPVRDQWEHVYSIDLSTGVQYERGSIYAGTVGRLHPSGRYLYLANRGLSPSDVEKWDVRSGIAIPMYDSPYHGDYSFGGDLWFLERGDRFVTRSANVFRASEARGEDMTFAGRLPEIGSIRSAAHTERRDRIYAFELASQSPIRGGDELWIFDSNNLELRARAPIPRIQGIHRSTGEYVFLGHSGARLYLLVRADPAAGLASDWAYIVFPTEGD